MEIKLNKLTPNIINEANNLFVNNDWSKEGREFNRFCTSLKYLTETERSLYFELLRGFLKYDVSNYSKGIFDTFNTIDKKLLDKKTRIFVYPLLREEDFNKNKSSKLVSYLFKNYQSNLEDSIIEKLNFRDKPGDGLPQANHFNNNDNYLIILVDDFIGSGDTALDAIKYLNVGKGYNIDQIIVLSLIVQEQGYYILKNAGINVFSNVIRKKGISDKFTGDTLRKYLKIMESIEKRLSVPKEYNFGYKRSEALTTLVGTPNNTFPIFWYEPKNCSFKAMFPRIR